MARNRKTDPSAPAPASPRARRRTVAPVQVHVELADLTAHEYAVTLTLAAPQAGQILSLPVWIPGSYLVREFSRHLSDLQAEQRGRPCELVQLDKCRWRADCAPGAPLALRYRVYAFDNSVRTAWLDAQRGFFNATSVVLRCEGHEDQTHRLTLGALPAGWQAATGLEADGKLAWTSPGYEHLIDHPFELGAFWRGEFTAHGVPHEFVVAGVPPGFDGAKLLADTQRICEAQIAFWHAGADGQVAGVPFERYVFMLNAVDESYGGLEHRNSTALICNRRDLPVAALPGADPKKAAIASEGYVTLLGLISHEYFHTWNVKRLLPADFAPYDLTREHYTELLWFFEGFTSYYDDLILVRTGLIDEARYARLLAKTVNQVLGTPGRAVQSVAQASFDAWVKYYRPDENTPNTTVSYYTKGALVAQALDLTLRREGRGTLDGVMRRLWALAGQGGPITEADIANALRAEGRRDFRPELDAWVHGKADLPLAELLATQGVGWSTEPPTLAQRLGARTQDGPGGVKVQAVMRDSLAARVGLSAGDELLAFDGWRLAKVDDLALYGAFHDVTPARERLLLVSRDRRVLSLPWPAAVPAVTGAVALTVLPKAGAAERRRRQAWLGSKPA